jgi:phage protein D/phage baseplate assembly protein gpV
MPSSDLASQVSIKISGNDVQPDVMGKLVSLIIDQHTHIPDMFTLRFNDPGLQLMDNGPFALASEIEISAEKQGGDKVLLLKGELTAIEPEFREGMIAELVLRGFNRLHRLFREKITKAYVNVKDSDLAEQIARDASLETQIDTTNTVYDHVYQDNLSNLEFLMKRAWRIGYECFIQENTLYFRKPPEGSAQITLTWGGDLSNFRPRMNLAEQVDEVLVKGWDIDKQEPIVGRAQTGNLYPKLEENSNGATSAQSFGPGKLVIVNQNVISQAEADALAAARLNEISGAFVEAEGIVLRRPDIRAGQIVKLEALGKRFSGEYLVTRTTHMYSPEGLKTIFSVSGTRSGLLSEQIGAQKSAPRWFGALPALVTNTDDPQKWGRVKLKYPWLADDVESDWARVMGFGAGPNAGLCVIPNIGDEVLVIFAHGDINQPYVLGSVWNGQSDLPEQTRNAPSGEMPQVQTWRTRDGHSFVFYENADKKIEIKTIDGRKIELSDKDKKITIQTDNAKIIVEDNKISIQSSTEIKIKAETNLKLEASGNVDIQAGGQVSIKGAIINLN